MEILEMDGTSVSMREFVAAWQSSNSTAEVASKTGLSANAIRTRASRLRSRGVPLKLFPVALAPTDWDELREYARGLLPPDQRGAEGEDTAQVAAGSSNPPTVDGESDQLGSSS